LPLGASMTVSIRPRGMPAAVRIGRPGQQVAVHLGDAELGQQQVAELARQVVFVDLAGRVLHRVVAAEGAGQLAELVGTGAPLELRVIGRDFLQADHIGIELAQHIDDRVNPDPPIPAASPVNVPAYNTHLPPPVYLDPVIVTVLGRRGPHGKIWLHFASV
jgi:hypothetical protein